MWRTTPLLIIFAYVSVCVLGCHGPPSFWEARMCRENVTVPPDDACISMDAQISPTYLTWHRVLEAPRNASNMALMALRQLAATRMNRLEENNYLTTDTLIVDLVAERVIALIYENMHTQLDVIPEVTSNDPNHRRLQLLAIALARYNVRESEVDVGWTACDFGKDGTDHWDETVLGVSWQTAPEIESPSVITGKTGLVLTIICVAGLVFAGIASLFKLSAIDCTQHNDYDNDDTVPLWLTDDNDDIDQ